MVTEASVAGFLANLQRRARLPGCVRRDILPQFAPGLARQVDQLRAVAQVFDRGAFRLACGTGEPAQ